MPKVLEALMTTATVLAVIWAARQYPATAKLVAEALGTPLPTAA